jgi:hypothetical protein
MKIMRSFRFNNYVDKWLRETAKKINTTKTAFVEMAIIEKISRIEQRNIKNDNLVEKDIKVAKNGLKIANKG